MHTIFLPVHTFHGFFFLILFSFILFFNTYSIVATTLKLNKMRKKIKVKMLSAPFYFFIYFPSDSQSLKKEKKQTDKEIYFICLIGKKNQITNAFRGTVRLNLNECLEISFGKDIKPLIYSPVVLCIENNRKIYTFFLSCINIYSLKKYCSCSNPFDCLPLNCYGR